MSAKKDPKSTSIVNRIEDSITWAKGRMCRPCRAGEQVCPACVKAQEAVDLLIELQVQAVEKTVVATPVPIVVELPVAAVEVKKCDYCNSGSLLFDGESCDECKLTRADRKLPSAKRFW